jgi:hypothetical protein
MDSSFDSSSLSWRKFLNFLAGPTIAVTTVGVTTVGVTTGSALYTIGKVLIPLTL